VLLSAPMRVKTFSVRNDDHDNLILTVVRTTKTPSGKPSYYNGFIVKYFIAGTDQEQTVTSINFL